MIDALVRYWGEYALFQGIWTFVLILGASYLVLLGWSWLWNRSSSSWWETNFAWQFVQLFVGTAIFCCAIYCSGEAAGRFLRESSQVLLMGKRGVLIQQESNKRIQDSKVISWDVFAEMIEEAKGNEEDLLCDLANFQAGLFWGNKLERGHLERFTGSGLSPEQEKLKERILELRKNLKKVMETYKNVRRGSSYDNERKKRVSECLEELHLKSQESNEYGDLTKELLTVRELCHREISRKTLEFFQKNWPLVSFLWGVFALVCVLRLSINDIKVK